MIHASQRCLNRHVVVPGILKHTVCVWQVNISVKIYCANELWLTSHIVDGRCLTCLLTEDHIMKVMLSLKHAKHTVQM